MDYSFWTQRKKAIARLVLQAISVSGMMIGLSLVCVVIMMVLCMSGDDPVFLCFSLIYMGLMLTLALYLIYTSYLMFRGRAFGAIKLMAAVFGLSILGSFVGSIHRFTGAAVSGIQARTLISLAAYLAALFPSFLIYWICTRLLKRLVQVAYSPEASNHP